MGSRRVRLYFRSLTRTILLTFVIFAVIIHIGILLFPNELFEQYERLNREFEGSPGIFSDFVTRTFWTVFGIAIFFEFLNMLLINHTKSILDDEELEMYLKNEINKETTLVMIPAYNEEKTIKEAIEVAQNAGKALVIDDGSTDSTAEIAKKYSDFVIAHSRNKGLAQGISNGIDFGLKNDFEQMVIFDADLQYTQTDLINVVKVLQSSNFDLVMGSRLQGSIEKMKLTKRFGNWIFSKTLTYITGIPISDGQTGLRAFSATFAGNIKFRGQFTYTQEMLFETAKYDFEMAEIPIEFKTRKAGESRLMAGAVDYAVKAWSLNLQIIAEYNPLKFTFLLIAGLLSLSIVTLTKDFDVETVLILLLIAIYLVLFTLGIFISIVINRLDKQSEGINYKILE